MSADSHNQAVRAEQARRRLQYGRRWAGGLLLLACVLFVLSTLYQPHYPWLGYLKAFSEAAMVGGLADWFAVTALFRHPLGLPIPHTAILPRKQARIGEELGRFIEHNFLQGKSIALRVYRWHPADRLLAWLAQPGNRRHWLPWLTTQLPWLLRAAKPQQFARFGSQLLGEQYTGRQLGQGLADVLGVLRQQGWDTVMLRALLQQTRRWLQQPETRQQLEQSLLAWAGKIERAAPSTWDKIKAGLKISLAERLDDWVADKALDWADGYLAAALADEAHPLWQAYARQADAMTRALRHSRIWHRRLEAGKQQLASSPALQHLLSQLWQTVCDWSARDAGAADSVQQRQLARLLEHMLWQAARHPEFMRRLDVRLALWVRLGVERYKHQGAQFVADKVQSWDSRQMVDKLELSVGRDLQFIRINGTLVGGVAGLLIYTVSQWLIGG